MDKGDSSIFPHNIMPDECSSGKSQDPKLRRSVHGIPNLVSQARELHKGPLGDNLNKARASFYHLDSSLSSSNPSKIQSQKFSSGAESRPGDDKEFLFPIDQTRRKSSLPDNLDPRKLDSSYHSSPKLYHRYRAHSISVTNPVCRSTYESLPQSPATSFLAQFAQADDWKSNLKIEDGRIIDRYRLGKVIGRGSFSECREGAIINENEENSETPKVIAMKIVTNEHPAADNLSDFERECSIWKRLKHRNILPLLDFLQLDNVRIAISPIAEKGTLLDYIGKNGPLSEVQAKVMFRQIAEAVSHMHNGHGIIHRDIKLDNILLDSQLRPYLCDFGLSEFIRPENQQEETYPAFANSIIGGDLVGNSKGRTEDDIFCKGSLWYLPPEELDPSLTGKIQERDKSQADEHHREKTDIWALGVVLYGMISGKLPFTDDFLPRLQLSVATGEYPPLAETFSVELLDLVSQLLKVDVKERPGIDMVLKHPWLSPN